MTPEEEIIAHATRRTVGIAALRRLRRLVDQESAQERREARWAVGIASAFALAATVFFIWLLNRAA